MNFASRDLCRELYAASHWVDIDFVYPISQPERQDPYLRALRGLGPFTTDELPAYDLGYLLRKLPTGISLSKAFSGTKYFVGIQPTNNYPEFPKLEIYDHNPEDALARMCIRLFKQGILKRD